MSNIGLAIASMALVIALAASVTDNLEKNTDSNVSVTNVTTTTTCITTSKDVTTTTKSTTSTTPVATTCETTTEVLVTTIPEMKESEADNIQVEIPQEVYDEPVYEPEPEYMAETEPPQEEPPVEEIPPETEYVEPPSSEGLTYIKHFSRGTYYAYGCEKYGGSGRYLYDCSYGDGNGIKGSIASSYLYSNYGYNYNGERTKVYLEVNGYPDMNGWYYLDDSDAGNWEVIDFFYIYGSNCQFQYQGVVEVDAYI